MSCAPFLRRADSSGRRALAQLNRSAAASSCVKEFTARTRECDNNDSTHQRRHYRLRDRRRNQHRRRPVASVCPSVKPFRLFCPSVGQARPLLKPARPFVWSKGATRIVAGLVHDVVID